MQTGPLYGYCPLVHYVHIVKKDMYVSLVVVVCYNVINVSFRHLKKSEATAAAAVRSGQQYIAVGASDREIRIVGCW